jgi:hypothetical protein
MVRAPILIDPDRHRRDRRAVTRATRELARRVVHVV